MSTAEDRTEAALRFYPMNLELTAKEEEAMRLIRDNFANVATYMFDLLPEGDELTLCFRKLEEASMWANKAITHNKNR